FTALFGIAIMDGVLMVRWITTLRSQGLSMDEAIVRGALERLRPILMTSIVAIFGLLPASLATGLGSDVQRPLATVIVWGLFSAMMLTLFILPVFYRLFVPGLPRQSHRGTGEEAGFVEPLPDAGTPDIVELLEFVGRHGGEEEIYQIADEMNREFGAL